MKVFIAATSLREEYGGPAYSVARLADALSNLGLEIGLWVADGSWPTSLERTVVRRLRGNEIDALEAFGRPDIVHDNGIWRAHNHSLARLCDQRRVTRVVSTRGMLEPWAMRHKRMKKTIAWQLYQRADLRAASVHHATSRNEADNISQLSLGVPVRVVPNGVDAPDVLLPSQKDGPRTAVFVGRIYPVKGLPMLVEAWARVRPLGWRLVIAGPDEKGHALVIARTIDDLRVGDSVSMARAVAGKAKADLLASADIFILPTHSESFGMAIAEALAHGLPVLTTTAAPWPALETHNCGWRVAPTTEGVAGGLRRAMSTSMEDLSRMGANGRDLVRSEFKWEMVAQKFVALYREISR